MEIRRTIQVVRYGWKHAGDVVRSGGGKNRWAVYLDILLCYRKYHLWSNQYVKERFYAMNVAERVKLGQAYKDKNDRYEQIKQDKLENRKFLHKWSSYKWELGYEKRRKKRQAAYAQRYNMGRDCDISYDVVIERNHFLQGTISIGDNVLLGKHTYIDYSGDVTIRDGVRLANGVIIESHHRDLEALNAGRDVNIPTKLEIGENAYIGSRAIILDSCNYIGKNARIGAGAVVTKDIPDYAVAVGVPAKVVKMLPHNE